MHVWIAAMLVISILLIMRDMAKNILSLRQKQEELPAGQILGQPQREGGEIRPGISETGRYFLWNALQKRLPVQRAGGRCGLAGVRTSLWELPSETGVLGRRGASAAG